MIKRILFFIIGLFLTLPIMAYSPENPLILQVQTQVACTFTKPIEECTYETLTPSPIPVTIKFDGRTIEMFYWFKGKKTDMVMNYEISKTETFDGSILKLLSDKLEGYILIDEGIHIPDKIRVMEVWTDKDNSGYIDCIYVYDCKKVDSIPMH